MPGAITGNGKRAVNVTEFCPPRTDTLLRRCLWKHFVILEEINTRNNDQQFLKPVSVEEFQKGFEIQ